MISSLCRPPFAGFPEQERRLDLVETHISWVLLGENLVWKLKKPKDLGFLDFRAIDQRKEACLAELRLNRRLAAETYLAVVPVFKHSGEYRLGSAGEVPSDPSVELVDWAVKMRRLPDGCRADVLLEAGKLERRQVEQVAVVLSQFHQRCDSSPEIAAFGDPANIQTNVQENFEQARGLSLNYISAAQEAEIEARQLAFLSSNAELFQRRVAAGRVREGHGDLRLEHVYLGQGGLQIIDCIEFNERFRYEDVCADLAFLFMDLNHHDRADLSEALLSSYTQETGDYELYSLVDFYESYRAYVRAKVLSFLAADASAAPVARETAAHEARRYYLHSLAAQRAPLSTPMVIATCGIIGSGKSTAAAKVSGLLGFPVVTSDRTRKQLFGKDVKQRLSDEAYAGEVTERVYDEVFRRASNVLASGRGVIVDASFRTEWQRRGALELSARHGVPLRFIECRVPRAVAVTRLTERSDGASISDGRADLYDSFAASFEPIQATHAARHIVLDTSKPDAEQVAFLRQQLS